MSQGTYTEKIVRTKPKDFVRNDPKRNKNRFKTFQKNRDRKRQFEFVE